VCDFATEHDRCRLEERDLLPYLKCRPMMETLANMFEA
jgi:hypothetical protein